MIPSIQSGGIVPERSGLKKLFNVFHPFLEELLFLLSFLAILWRSAFLDF